MKTLQINCHNINYFPESET